MSAEAFTVFPAVDILGGRCVQLRRGEPEASTVYYDDPLDAARHWVDEGAEALHVVDLDATLGRGSNTPIVERLIAAVPVPVQVGGGVRDAVAFNRLVEVGAAHVVVGTAVVETPDLVEALAAAHTGRVVVAADVRDGMVVTKGWTASTGLSVADLLARVTHPGLGGLLVTEVGRDGMLEGPSIALYRELVGLTRLPVIASGGVSSAADVDAVRATGAAGAVIGTALYEGRLRLSDVR
jgi:phosphoribosylformimino-5-aminoimidazole carboxamide ribotide isomerase